MHSGRVAPRTRSITPSVGVEAGFGPDESLGGFVDEVQAELAVELGFVVWGGFGEYCGDVAERRLLIIPFMSRRHFASCFSSLASLIEQSRLPLTH